MGDPKLVPVARVPRSKRKPNPNNVPLWASKLAETVCAEHEMDTPAIRWRQRRGPEPFSSGSTMRIQGTIAVTAGKVQRDQRLVVLHELGHWLTPKGHTYRFWATAWDLYETYMEDELDYIALREALYRKKAVDAMPLDRLDPATVEVCTAIRNGLRFTEDGRDEWRRFIPTIASMDGRNASRVALSVVDRLSV